jgi:hypothetical protein
VKQAVIVRAMLLPSRLDYIFLRVHGSAGASPSRFDFRRGRRT